MLNNIRREYLNSNIRYSTLSTTKGTTEIKLSHLTVPYRMIKVICINLKIKRLHQIPVVEEK